VQVKVYAIIDAEDRLLDLKLTRAAANSVARFYAPAKVVPITADKEPYNAAAPVEQQQWPSED
jgi:hypothetical protein